jgi:hypothetical protein
VDSCSFSSSLSVFLPTRLWDKALHLQFLTERFIRQGVAFTVGISLAPGILFGLVPAWQATRTNVNSGLKDATHATSSRQKMGLGKSLVIFQIALSAILLIGAGLFVRTLVNLSHTPLGFQPDNILFFRLAPREPAILARKQCALSPAQRKIGCNPWCSLGLIEHNRHRR